MRKLVAAGVLCVFCAGSIGLAEPAAPAPASEATVSETPPKSGPIIRVITRVTQTSLLTRFSGQDVRTIDWGIKGEDGAVAASGSFSPSNNTPSITYSKLPPGRYSLMFRGQASRTGDEKEFEIDEDRVVRMGVIEKTAGGQLFRMVNGRNCHAEILPTGAVRLVYPETQKSQNGMGDTRAWVMNSYMVPLKPEELEALSTTGLKLPEGNHTFYIYYFDVDLAKDLDELRANWHEIAGNSETCAKHIAPMEYVMLEIRDEKPTASDEIKAPRDIHAVTWYPQYQETTNRLNLPLNKKFGITKRIEGIPSKRLVEQGTFLQACYEDVNNNNIPYNRTWLTMRAYAKGEVKLPYDGTIKAGQTVTVEKDGLNCKPGDIISIHKGYSSGLPGGLSLAYSIPKAGVFRCEIKNDGGEDKVLGGGTLDAKYFGSVEEEAQRLYDSGARKGAIVASEICENGVPFDDVERIYRGIYELQKKKDGVKSPNDTEIYSDYFAHLYSYALGLSGNAAQKRELFSTPEMAQKGSVDGGPSKYFSEKAYEYRHRIAGGYLDSIARLLNGRRLYSHVATLEKQYIAMPDRHVATFGWTAFEGCDSQVERGATWQRLPLEGGDLLRVTRPEGSFEQLKYETFISLLIGDSYVSWNDNGMYGTNINGFGLAHIGGPADWKNRWQPVGGEEVQYDPNDSLQPKAEEGKGGWSDGAAAGHNGGFVGAWLLSQIQDRINKSLRYPAFSYSVGGREYTGYPDGNKPVKGRQGNSEVSRLGKGNAGQCNIINQEEQGKPIVFFGEGTGGKCLIVINPFAGLTEKTTYKVSEGAGYTVSHTGPYLGVYRLGARL